ncbi:MAG: TetR family transcriptional regulator [Sphingobium sp.]
MAPRKKVGKDAILDAAEELFSQLGYHGVSLRDITRLAQFELGLASYHFGTKEELFRQVVERRADEWRAAEIGALDEIRQSREGRPPNVEDILRAYIRVRFDLMFARGVKWARYGRISHHFLALEDRGRFIGRYRDIAQDVCVRYVDALCETLPSVSREKIAVSFDFLRLTLTSVSGDTTSIVLSSSTKKARETAIGTLVEIYSAGMRNLQG